MRLRLDGKESIVEKSEDYQFHQNLSYKKYLFFYGNESVFDDIITKKKTFSPGHIICTEYKNNILILKEPNIDNKFYFSYLLNFTEGNYTYGINGEAVFKKPIESISQVEEINIQTNKRILILTGWLLILGSFPFTLSIRNFLINK